MMSNSGLQAKQASAQSFRRYGTFVAGSQGAPFEGASPASYKEKVGIMDIGGGRVSVGVLNLKARALTFSELERHIATPELLVVVEGDVVFPVAPANHPDNAPDAAGVELFRLGRGEAVIMSPGVWHGLPFPLGPSATLLVVFKEGTPDHDFELVKTQQGTEFEITL